MEIIMNNSNILLHGKKSPKIISSLFGNVFNFSSEEIILIQEIDIVMHDYVNLIKEEELNFDARFKLYRSKTFGRPIYIAQLMQKILHTYCLCNLHLSSRLHLLGTMIWSNFSMYSYLLNKWIFQQDTPDYGIS